MIKLVLAIVLLGAAAFAIYMLQQNLDPLNADDLKKAAASSKTTLEKLPGIMDGTMDNLNESVIYKRKDAKGNWYYTNEPPKKGEESESLIYRSDTNVLPPLSTSNSKSK
ncbi:MAG: hypothetical protein L0Z73_02610 [Gammaproteobacteria bacterium]|nr:hypothetical protein [Gammaproteobacteria bacterium]